MRHQTTCKICHKPLFIEIDDEYSSMGDPAKLIPMATCNTCYDLRDRRIKAEEKIYHSCLSLAFQRPSQPEKDKLRTVLTNATKSYVRWFCDFHRLTPWENCWSEDFVNLLMEKPRDWDKTLRNYRKQFRPT